MVSRVCISAVGVRQDPRPTVPDSCPTGFHAADSRALLLARLAPRYSDAPPRRRPRATQRSARDQTSSRSAQIRRWSDGSVAHGNDFNGSVCCSDGSGLTCGTGVGIARGVCACDSA